MRLKGYRPLRRGLRQTVSSEVASLRPVLAGAIRRSQEVALSILTRGFAFGGVRTSLYQERLSPRERAAATAVGLLVLLMTACKTAFWLYQQELYYAPFLRPVYALARHWL
jgi:energy-coupling factor transport system permease protein